MDTIRGNQLKGHAVLGHMVHYDNSHLFATPMLHEALVSCVMALDRRQWSRGVACKVGQCGAELWLAKLVSMEQGCGLQSW